MRSNDKLQLGIRYLVAGSFNSVVGLAVIFLCMSVFGMSALEANAAGFAVGFLSSFFINRNFTFGSKVALLPGLALFLAVVVCGYAANILTLLIATRWLGINPYLAQFMGIGIYIVLVFVGSERFVYRSRSQ